MTHLRCGGIFSASIITNVLLTQTVNEFENRSIFDEIKVYKTKGVSFLNHPVCFIMNYNTAITLVRK